MKPSEHRPNESVTRGVRCVERRTWEIFESRGSGRTNPYFIPPCNTGSLIRDKQRCWERPNSFVRLPSTTACSRPEWCCTWISAWQRGGGGACSFHAWPTSCFHRPSRPSDAGTAYVGLSPNFACQADIDCLYPKCEVKREVFGTSHDW